MRGINKVMLIGRVGMDPELRRMDNSRSKLNLRLATTESYKNPSGEWQDITDWHTIVMWGPMADRGEKDIKKGNLIYVEGKIRTRSWEDKEGHKRYATEIIAEYYQNLSPKDNYSKETKSDHSSEDDVNLNELNSTEDNLPF
jgi:single-strand DNA-binding protein